MFHPIHPNQKKKQKAGNEASAPSCTPASCKVCRPGKKKPTTLQFPSLEKQKNTPWNQQQTKTKRKQGWFGFPADAQGLLKFFVFREGYPPVEFKSRQNSPELQKTTPSLSKSVVFFFLSLANWSLERVLRGVYWIVIHLGPGICFIESFRGAKS